MTHLVPRESTRFEFVGYGAQVEHDQDPEDRLYLDVGNALGPGVIDSHHLAAHSGSVASLVLRNPTLVAGAVRPDRQDGDPFTVVLHEWPDLDCVGSAYLAVKYLSTGNMPVQSEQLARYLDAVDDGYLGACQEHPFSLYAAYMLLVHDRSLEKCDARQTVWHDLVEQGLTLIDFVIHRADEEGLSILEVDAFDCADLFRPRDRREIENDLDRYRKHVRDASKHPRMMTLRLPTQFGGTKDVSTLLIRDVQNAGDPDRSIFFKDWARTDKENSSNGEGFVGLSVLMTENENQLRRCILSVAPASGTSLRGLAERLEQLEAERRHELHGVDDRRQDPETGDEKPNRVGFANSDPWYDGRGHNYTIVDAPRSGTLLTADEIEEVFIEFGQGTDASPEPEIPSPAHETRDDQLDEDAMRRLTFLVRAWGDDRKTQRSREPEIFISYSRRTIEWVEKNVYEPLASWRGADAIFFDKQSLAPGLSWLSELAWGVANCHVFVPVYSEPYFKSEFCQWELQLAVLRDPTGSRRIVVPVMLEELELPPYCKLIQGELYSSSNDWQPRLQGILLEVLSGTVD